MNAKSSLKYRASLIGCAMLAAAAASTFGPMAYAQSSNQVNLDPGTVIPVRITSELSSNQSSPGDTFVAKVDNNNSTYNSIMRGATIDGKVQDATPKDGNTPGTLDLKFTTLHLSNGDSFPINGTVTSLDSKMVKTGSDGIITARPVAKDHKLTYAGIGAGAGLLVGILGGHKVKIEDIILGAAAGYGVGALTQQSGSVHDVDLQSGTPMGVILGNRVSYYHHRSNGYGNNNNQGQSYGQDNYQYSQNRYRTNGGYHNGNYSQQGTPSSYVRNGVKHYWYNGDEWTMDMNTGERRVVSQSGNYQNNNGQTNDYQYNHRQSSGGRDYTYQGHRYHLNADTGERTQLD